MESLTQPTEYVSQDTFPGCVIEAKWNVPTAQEKAARYALMLMMYEPVIHKNFGSKGYNKFCIEGTNYAIHEANFKYIEQLVKVAEMRMKMQRYSMRNVFSNPHETISYLCHMEDDAKELIDVPSHKTRFLWLNPANALEDGSSHYRNELPFRYMLNNMADKFHPERVRMTNQAGLIWNDVFILHRVPNEQTFAYMETYQQAGKLIIYEWDDDFFNIPPWNHNAKQFTRLMMDRLQIVQEKADLIIGSTATLCMNYPEKSHQCPNLVSFREYNWSVNQPPYDPDKLEGWFWSEEQGGSTSGYTIVNKENGLTGVVPNDKPLKTIRVLWAGSPTHDHDLDIIVPVVKKIGEKHGLSIQFIFFGYCPTEFLDGRAQPGNSRVDLSVKQEYASFITYVPPCKFDDYKEKLKQIAPHVALCPLVADPFNYAKSSLKLLEMAAMGIPVICSDIGQFGPYDILRDSFPELLIPGDSKEQEEKGWEEAILMYVKDHEARVSTGKELKKWVYDNHSWDTDNENRRKWHDVFNIIHDMVTIKKVELNANAEFTLPGCSVK